MAIESVSGRDPNDVNASDLDESQSTSSGAPPPNASSATNASSASSATNASSSSGPTESSNPAVRQLTSKYTPAPSFDGCGYVQDCADLDGRPVRQGQNASEPNANLTVTVRRFAPFETFGGKFEGDAKSRNIPTANEGQGGFTTDPAATSRTRMSVQVDEGVVLKPVGYADMSRHPLLGEARTHVYTRSHSTAITPTSGGIEAKSAGAMPLIPGSPNMDTELRAEYAMKPGTLQVDAWVWGDKFPNAELIATDSTGTAVMIGQFQTQSGPLMGPLTLAGDAPRAQDFQLIRGHAEIPLDPNGNFAGSPNVRQK